mmetsp:Transcript_97912/g.281679  ORF Transcript_97912/g.281679 Transcript_97912/m.281679 type:complete len:252 (-) Transcript_97912:486-1241(-)
MMMVAGSASAGRPSAHRRTPLAAIHRQCRLREAARRLRVSSRPPRASRRVLCRRCMPQRARHTRRQLTTMPRWTRRRPRMCSARLIPPGAPPTPRAPAGPAALLARWRHRDRGNRPSPPAPSPAASRVARDRQLQAPSPTIRDHAASRPAPLTAPSTHPPSLTAAMRRAPEPAVRRTCRTARVSRRPRRCTHRHRREDHRRTTIQRRRHRLRRHPVRRRRRRAQSLTWQGRSSRALRCRTLPGSSLPTWTW